MEAGIRPEIFYFVRAADPRLVATHNGFNLDKIAPFIRREAYRKRHVGRWHRPVVRSGIEVILTLVRLRSSAFHGFNRAA